MSGSWAEVADHAQKGFSVGDREADSFVPGRRIDPSPKRDQLTRSVEISKITALTSPVAPVRFQNTVERFAATPSVCVALLAEESRAIPTRVCPPIVEKPPPATTRPSA